jgi:hypothetical protein
MCGSRWEGTGGLLQFLNSGDELKAENSNWSVWTPQIAGTQYAEPAHSADTNSGALSAAVDSKDVGKKFAQAIYLILSSLNFWLTGTTRWQLVPATASFVKT